jgi:hypothetical protein
MALRFRIETTKKSGPRIAVVREIVQENGIVKTEQIGTFSARKNPEALHSKFINDEERYEFKNYLSQLKFNKTYFGTEADKLGRIIVRLDETARKKITELALQCDKHGIPFIPEDCMLHALFKRAATAEAKLNQQLGKKVNLIESLNISIPEIIQPQEPDTETIKPFKALLKLNKPLEVICADFTELARKYHKTTNFKPDYFKYYAGILHNDNQKKPSKWYYGIAVELLKKYKVDPLTILPVEKIAEYRGWLQKGLQPIDQAVLEFMKLFEIKENLKQQVIDGMRKSYGTSIY